MDPDEALLSFLRGGDYLRGLHVSGMFDLCRALKRHGLLPAMAGRIEGEMPKCDGCSGVVWRGRSFMEVRAKKREPQRRGIELERGIRPARRRHGPRHRVRVHLPCAALALALVLVALLTGCSALSGQPENAFDAVCYGGGESLSANDEGLGRNSDGLEFLWSGLKFGYAYEDSYVEENFDHDGNNGGWYLDSVYVDYHDSGLGDYLRIIIYLERAEDDPEIDKIDAKGEFYYYPWQKELCLEDTSAWPNYSTYEEGRDLRAYTGRDYRDALCEALAFVVGDLLSRMDDGGGYSASDWGDFSFCDETDLGLTADDLAEAARGGE